MKWGLPTNFNRGILYLSWDLEGPMSAQAYFDVKDAERKNFG